MASGFETCFTVDVTLCRKDYFEENGEITNLAYV